MSAFLAASEAKYFIRNMTKNQANKSSLSLSVSRSLFFISITWPLRINTAGIWEMFFRTKPFFAGFRLNHSPATGMRLELL